MANPTREYRTTTANRSWNGCMRTSNCGWSMERGTRKHFRLPQWSTCAACVIFLIKPQIGTSHAADCADYTDFRRFVPALTHEERAVIDLRLRQLKCFTA